MSPDSVLGAAPRSKFHTEDLLDLSDEIAGLALELAGVRRLHLVFVPMPVHVGSLSAGFVTLVVCRLPNGFVGGERQPSTSCTEQGDELFALEGQAFVAQQRG